MNWNLWILITIVPLGEIVSPLRGIISPLGEITNHQNVQGVLSDLDLTDGIEWKP